MALYLLADFVVKLDNQHEFITRQCMEYRYDGTDPVDFTIRVTEDEINGERGYFPENLHSLGYLESICAYRKLCVGLPMRNAMVIHGSVIECDGNGIAFLARSGVGKTTHTMLWKQVYGDAVTIINGDKPIIRFFDGVPFAYGTPWSGKENLQTNRRVRLTDICLIQRGTENAVFRIDPAQQLDAFMQQILIPTEPAAAERTLELLDSLLSECRVWVIQCNISQEAAIIAFNAIMGDKE